MLEIERFGNDIFPPPAEVRKRLADNLTEARILRRLLCIVEDAAAERYRGKTGSGLFSSRHGKGGRLTWPRRTSILSRPAHAPPIMSQSETRRRVRPPAGRSQGHPH